MTKKDLLLNKEEGTTKQVIKFTITQGLSDLIRSITRATAFRSKAVQGMDLEMRPTQSQYSGMNVISLNKGQEK